MSAGALSEGDDIISNINVTPLVDIMLVLLIVFMLTTTMMQYPVVPIELPHAIHTSDAPSKNLQISLDKDNKIYVNGSVRSPDELQRILETEVRSDANVNIVLGADGAIKYQNVMTIIDMVKGVHAKNFALNVNFASMNEAGGAE